MAQERIGQAEPKPAALEPGGRLSRRPDADPERTVHAGDQKRRPSLLKRRIAASS